MTTFASNARSTYLSPHAAAVYGALSFAIGFCCGVMVGSLWLAMGWARPREVAMFAFATATLTALLKCSLWVGRKLDRIDDDAVGIEMGARQYAAPLVIEHRTPTDGGLVTQRVNCPLSAAQLQWAAKVLLPHNGQFNLRSMYEIAGQSGAVKFRDWLLTEGYAVKVGETGEIAINSVGMEMLRKAAHYDPYPTDGRLVTLDAVSRNIHTGYTKK
jgi:hypothetical protein